MSDTPSTGTASAEVLRAALTGLAEGMPSIGPAVKQAIERQGQMEAPAANADRIVQQVLTSAGRGEPTRTRAIAALPPEKITEAVREAAPRMSEEDKTRLAKAAEGRDGAPTDPEEFLHVASQVLADSPIVRHTLLSYSQEHLGRGKPLSPGDRIGTRFEVIEFLGEGGMGTVYRVQDHRRGKEVALKLLMRSLVDSAPARERFRKEVNLALELTHPNIIRVYDMDECDGQPYLHMEIIDGDTLRALLAAGPLPLDRAMSIARGFLGALAFAHRKGVLHLDVKPENILLGRDGEVKLADFGLARAMGSDAMRTMVAGVGTPYYMAPEQLKGEELDARADVFAAGAVLYEMLVGEPPIGVFEPIPDSVPKGIRDAIQLALSHKREKRPQDAGALLTLIEAPPAQEEIPYAQLDEPPANLRRPPQPLAPRVASHTANPRVASTTFGEAAHRRRSMRRGAERPRGLESAGRNAQGLEVFVNSVGMRLILLSAGTFIMGDDAGAASERPPHPVELTRAFLLGETPVTQADYDAVMGTCPCRFRGTDLPVECVSWSGAILFLRFLGRRDGVTYRLPTEAEWEFACRAGTSTPFWWGHEEDGANVHAVWRDNSYGSTRPVSLGRPNAWGLAHMTGNVEEWCGDWFDASYYERCLPSATDPIGPMTGNERIARGGSWNSPVERLRPAARSAYRPDFRSSAVGFRVAMTFP